MALVGDINMMEKANAPPSTTTDADADHPEATKEVLQRRMDDARASISETVDEIRTSVEGQYAAVRSAVTGVLDWREGFQREPIVWSVGALSAGFALGYTLGVAQRRGGQGQASASAMSTFAESLLQELRMLGDHALVFDPPVKALFGVGVSDLLAEIGEPRSGSRRRGRRKPVASRQKARRRRR